MPDNQVKVDVTHAGFSKEAGRFVTMGSVWFVVGLLLVTVIQICFWYLGRQPVTEGPFTEDCGQIDCGILTLEAMVQDARASRVLDTIVSRHVIALVGMVIALAFVVLGAVLIFDRIEAQSAGELEIKLGAAAGDANAQGAANAVPAGMAADTPLPAGGVGATPAATGAETVKMRLPAGTGIPPSMFSVRSTFPGMLMCGCAIISLWMTLCFAYMSSKTMFVRDAAVFLPDYNFCRNVLNRQPGVVSEALAEQAAEEMQSNWKDIMRNYAHCFKTSAETARPDLVNPVTVDRLGDKNLDELLGKEK